MRSMFFSVLLVLFSFLLLLNIFWGRNLSWGFEFDPKESEESFQLNYHDGLMSASIRGIPLEEVLEEIEKICGIRIVRDTKLEEEINLQFESMPLEEALRKIMDGKNFIFLHTESSEGQCGDDKEGCTQPKLIEIRVLEGHSVPQKRIQSRSHPTRRAEAKKRMDSPKETLEDRKKTIKSLGEKGGKEAIDILTQALEDEERAIRESAIDALAQIGGADVIAPLGKALLKDKDEEIRTVAAETLGDIENINAINYLKEALNDSSPQVRAEVVDALGSIGDEGAVDALVTALKDKDEDVRENAADALSEIGGKKVIDSLTQTVVDADPETRNLADEILEDLTQ